MKIQRCQDSNMIRQQQSTRTKGKAQFHTSLVCLCVRCCCVCVCLCDCVCVFVCLWCGVVWCGTTFVCFVCCGSSFCERVLSSVCCVCLRVVVVWCFVSLWVCVGVCVSGLCEFAYYQYRVLTCSTRRGVLLLVVVLTLTVGR